MADTDRVERLLRGSANPHVWTARLRRQGELLPGLQALHAGVAGNFGAALAERVRCPVQVEAGNVEHVVPAQLENRGPRCLQVVRVEPLGGGPWLLDVEPTILLPIIDRLLGGDGGLAGGDRSPAGASRAAPLERALTDIERRLATRVGRLFLEEVRRGWEAVEDIQMEIERVESSVAAVGLSPRESLALLPFDLQMGAARGAVRLAIPVAAVEPLAERLPAEGRLETDARRALVRLVVRLAESRLDAADLERLEVGDLLATDQPVEAPLVVEVDGEARFRGRPGACGERKAVRLEGPLGPPDAEEAESADAETPPPA